MIKYAKKHLWLFALSMLLSALSVCAMLLTTIFAGDAIDYIIGKGNVNFSKVLYCITLLAVCIPIASGGQYLAHLLSANFSNKTVNAIRKDAYKSVSRLPLNKLDGVNHGDLVMRITTDAQRLTEGLNQALTPLCPGILTVIGTLVLMFIKNIYVAAFVAALTPLSIVFSFFIVRYGQKMLSRQVKHEAEMSALSEEYISNLRLLKLNNHGENAQKKFNGINAEIKKYGAKAVFISAIINPGARVINGVIYTGVCLIGALMIISGNFGLTVGGLSIFLSCTMSYAKPFNEITGVITELQAAAVSSKRLMDVIKGEREKDESNLPALNVNDSSLNFKNVDFSYSGEPFIKDFNLRVESGQKVAVVGHTGSGKTTLLSLIMRFYETGNGAIEIGGINTKEVSRDSLRANIGMVLQDTWLFKGSVRANIAYALEGATDTQIKEAAKRAGIDSFIERLPYGYNTVIEPQSVSQGQAQLISLSRIFLSLPKIIILDEATSNIDARTELKIQQALRQLTSNHTCFIVAHRLNTIRESDLILVMENGRIAEEGTHEQLLNANGIYADMLNQ